MRTLDILSEMTAPLEFLLTAENDAAGRGVKREIVEDISLAVANEIKRQGIADCRGSYLEPFGFAVQKKIKSAELRNMHILLG